MRNGQPRIPTRGTPISRGLLLALVLAELAANAWFRGVALHAASQSRTAARSDAVPVRFRLVLDHPARTVCVAGTFDAWQIGHDPMASADGGITWTATIRLEPGGYQYKFVVNGTDWRTDPTASSLDDGNGNRNSALWVGPRGREAYTARRDGSIVREAVLHDPMQLRYREADEGELYLTVRARRGDTLSGAALVRVGGRERTVALSLVGSDPLFSYYRATLPNRACAYAFRLASRAGVLYVDPDGVTSHAPSRLFHYAPHPNAGTAPPEWLRDAVFYQILPDRFDNADPSNDPRSGVPLDSTGRRDTFFGGDLQGVTRRLGYIRSIGANAIYLNPIFTSLTHHKYDTDDYQHVDPHLGGDAAFDRMAGAAWDDDIHLVLDGVFNHVGINFFAFKDLLRNQQRSPYRDWFFVQRYPVAVPRHGPPNYTAWWNIPYLPKLNQGNPRVRRYLQDAAARWTARGRLSGWRLDAANEVDDRFWREFRSRIRAVNPRAALVGEIWTDASHWLRGDMFDSVMNYRWRGPVLDWIAHRTARPSQFEAARQEMAVEYPHAAVYSMFNMLGSHDTPRLRTECGPDWRRRTRLAYLLQMTSPGAPSIYYGDEVAMEGGRDPDNRRPMDWNPGPDGRALREYLRALIRLRRSQPALRRGDWTTLLVDDPRNAYAYVRSGTGAPALVAINNGDQATTLSIPCGIPGLHAVFATDGPTPGVRQNGGQVSLSLPAESGVVMMGRG